MQRGGGPAGELSQVAAADVKIAAGQAAVGVGEDRGGWLGDSGAGEQLRVFRLGQVAVAHGPRGLGADLGRELGEGEGLVAAEFVDRARADSRPCRRDPRQLPRLRDQAVVRVPHLGVLFEVTVGEVTR